MITLAQVSKAYGRDAFAIEDFSLEIESGEFMVLVGPSGSGKSTLVRLIAGLSKASGGRILIGGRDVTHLPPQERDVAMVFQNYALYPHMSVRSNLEYGLRMHKVRREDMRKRVTEVARLLHLESLLDRKPAALSGGERQRVAMGRAIVREPQAFLLDEPLSNLDAKLRVEMRAEILQLRDRLRTATVYVTHDQIEAMTLGHRVAVLRDGTLQQVDSGRELYQRPSNLFVASFIGSPPMNIGNAKLDQTTIDLGMMSIPIPRERASMLPQGDALVVGIRPTSFEATDIGVHREWPSFTVTALSVEELGSEKIVIFNPWQPEAEDMLREDASARSKKHFQARVDARSAIRPGDSARLSVDPDALYYFDRQSEKTLLVPSAHKPSDLESA